MVAWPLLALHTPPGAASDKVMEAPVHTVEGPDMLPAERNGPTVTDKVVVAVPQLFVTVYLIVSVPTIRGVRIPDEEMEALPLVTPQVPPLTPSVYGIRLPIHTEEGPVIVPAVGMAFTVTTCVATADPQPLLTE
jgi:hypothetical protein